MTLPIKGGKVPSPLVGEGLGEGYFHVNIITSTPKITGNLKSLP